MEIKEIEIPVPWGVIAAKIWGDEKDPPIITLHGYQDNAGSFDTLIPLLPKSYYYICIDLPSHGKSTHLPVAMFITFLDFVVSLKLVLDYFGRKKYIIMGHSWGAQVAIFFTQMHPEYVVRLIMLDTLYFVPVPPNRCLKEYAGIADRYYKNLKNIGKSAPTYTKEEAVQRMIDARFSPITKKSAEILMERSLKPTGDGKFTITSAQHLKYIMRPPFTISYDRELLKLHPVICPHLIIMGKDSVMYKHMTKPWQKSLEKNRKFVFKVVPGNHDVHVENPERVAPNIIRFLEKQYSKL